jgi:two-component system phosphate regulon sensor histidine kinase PhoR
LSSATSKHGNLTARIFLKLIFGAVCVLIVAVVAVDAFASRVVEQTYTRQLTHDLESKGRMLALLGPERLARENQALIAGMAQAVGGRITVISRDGRVLADTGARPQAMENHASRPEVIAAFSGRTGSDARVSNTTHVKSLYVAIPLADGALRIAVPLSEVDGHVSAIRRQLLSAVGIAFVPAIIVAAVFARTVSSKLAAIIDYAGRLAKGDFAARLKGGGRDELGMLVEQLNETAGKLQKMFEQLESEHAELEKVERVRKDFVINVSHELRTPLASIQGYTETLLDGALQDPNHNVRFLTIIRQNAERLGRLTADLLTLSRLELKTTRMQFASYYADRLIAECVDSMRPIAEKKNIEIGAENPPPGTDVFCDSEAIHQVISNLLDNAIKYTPEGGSIAVGAGPADGEVDFVEFYVRDSGIGIPAADLPRLFERFYRVDKARSRELGGTGLGLAIVKHLVLAHGGSVAVESTPGSGSTFLFRLPVHDLGLPQADATAPRA